MKELSRYKSFNYMIAALTVFIISIFIYIANTKLILVLFLGGILLFVCLLFFLDEYGKSKRIAKNGAFVLGVLEPKSIKIHHLGKGLYILKASVRYYDEQRKMTLKFSGYDIFNNWEMRVGKVKRVRNENRELEVLVGYLPEEPEICELYLMDAFEKI